jgi:mono/diheme cytochrome c family protein
MIRCAPSFVLLCAVAVACATAVNAISNAAEAPRRLPPVVRPVANSTNAVTFHLYSQQCATCHGDNGRAAEAKADFPTIPNFADSRWQRTRSDAQLAASILDGRGDSMPPFSADLSRSQVVSLVDHIRSMSVESVPSTTPRTSEFARKYAALKQEWDTLAQESARLPRRN